MSTSNIGGDVSKIPGNVIRFDGYVPLPDSQRIVLPEKTIDELVQAAIDSFGSSMGRDEVIQHLLPNDVLFVAYDKQQKAFAFAAGNYRSGNNSSDYFYLAGAVVSPAYQGKGVYTHLTELRIQHSFLNGRDLPIKTRTQNPNVEDGIFRAFVKVCGISPSDVVVKREIIPGLYGRQLTKTLPREISRESPYAQLDYVRGDAFELTFSKIFEDRFW